MKTIIAIFLILHGLVHGILVMVPDPDSPEAGFARFFSQSWLLSALGLSESAGRIIPEEQQLQIGDKIRLSKGDGTPYFVVQAIEPGRAIILGGDDPPTTWSFILEPMDEHSTRLIIRFR